MYKVLRKGAYMLLVACLATGMAGCSDDDPNYNNVIPPKVEVAPNTVTGVITDISGAPLHSATVTLGTETVSSDANGVYVFPDVKPGVYVIRAEATGKRTKEGEITLSDVGKTQNLVWNASLLSDAKVEVVVSETEDSRGSVDTETLKDNILAEVNVAAVVAAGAIELEEEETVQVIITPIYDADEAAKLSRSMARADDAILLIGANLSCSKSGVKLAHPIELSFQVDEEVAKNVETMQYKDGQWVPVDSREEEGKVIIETDVFTSYGLFHPVTFGISEESEAVVFDQSEWNNLYGAQAMQVGSAGFTYKTGTEIELMGTTKLTALLVEKLAQRFGATSSTVRGSYPLNVTLPIGTALTISGAQRKQIVSASALGKSVTGTHYGTVTVEVITYNRQHTGGSN